MPLSKIVYATIQQLFIPDCIIYAKVIIIDSCHLSFIAVWKIDMSPNWTELFLEVVCLGKYLIWKEMRSPAWNS